MSLHNINDTEEHIPKVTRVVTFTDQKKFKFYCWRDISGTFIIDSTKYVKEKTFYVNLSLREEILFADPITEYDYQKQKDLFIQKNRFKDTRFDQNETKRTSIKVQHKIIKLTEETPQSITWYYYGIFVVLCFVELYKIYMSYYTVIEYFTIKKLISSRNNLKEEDYKDSIPKLKLFDKEYVYENISKVNNKIKVKIPTQEEIEQANNYLSNKENTNTLNEDISLQVDMKNNRSIEDNPLIQTQAVNSQVSLL